MLLNSSKIASNINNHHDGGDKTLKAIEDLARKREERRKQAEETKLKKIRDSELNEAKGRPGDVDFQRMIDNFRVQEMTPARSHVKSLFRRKLLHKENNENDLHLGQEEEQENNNNEQEEEEEEEESKISVIVRKRPVNENERNRRDYDCVTCSNPTAVVHHCKFRVDGITKYLDNTRFVFDHAFDEFATNEEVYACTAKPLVEFALSGGRSTCFAYGQTGSGKTHTMLALQRLAAQDVFRLVKSPELLPFGLSVGCSFFELYGGRCLDLLNDRRICAVREDSNSQVHVDGLQEVLVESVEGLLDVIARGSSQRTTHATESNQDSSRSHAICQIVFRFSPAALGMEDIDMTSFPEDSKQRRHRMLLGRKKEEEDAAAAAALENRRIYGKLSLIDLAGSERGQDTKSHNKARRAESAEINKSLLALKECIRALESSEMQQASIHVPFRASKLTMILKDSFVGNSRTVMISCLSPCASSSDHTLNTLRYADRVKEKKAITSTNGSSQFSKIKFGSGNYPQKEQQDSSRLEAQSPVLSDLSSEPGDDVGGIIDDTDNDYENDKNVTEFPQRGVLVSKPKSNGPPPPPPPPPPSSSSSSNLSLFQKTSSSRPSSQTLATTNMSSSPPITTTTSNKKVMESRPKVAMRSTRESISPPPPPPIKKTNSRSSQLDNENEEDFQSKVSQLIDDEEALLDAHLRAIQLNARVLEEEGNLLSRVQGDGVDYDIDEYTRQLDALLDRKLDMFQNLKDQLTTFRKNLIMIHGTNHHHHGNNYGDEDYY